MDWLKKNYDKAALGLLALALLVSGVFVAINAMGLPENFKNRNSTKPPNNNVAALPVQEVASSEAIIAKPPTGLFTTARSLFRSPMFTRMTS